MALIDFYTSNENAYKNNCPIGLVNIDSLTTGWTQYIGKDNIFYIYFANYAPKVVAEHYSILAKYGKPYTRAFDLQTLDSMIHGGYYYDTITKNLYIKCFNLANPNSKTILLSNLQSIEAKGDSYYVHRNMRIGEHSGIKWEAIIGAGQKFIAGDAFAENLNPFYFSCLVIDPEPHDSILINFPEVADTTLEGVKFPGTNIRYWINIILETIQELRDYNVANLQVGSVRYAFVRFETIPGNRINATFRYDATSSSGEIKPTHSNGSGVGAGNGWWVRVWGIELEKVITDVVDLATLAALPTQNYLNMSLRRVLSNGAVYKYIALANAGNIKPTISNGTGTPGQYNGWWIAVPANEVDDWGYILTANHCGITLKIVDGSLTLSAQSIQQIPVYTRTLETMTTASFKMALEVFPRTGVPSVLDYTLKITKITTMGGATGTPTIYNGTIEGLPATGNFANYLTGISLAEGTVVDDLIISEIIESVI
jgi:hypothetical protein